MSAASRPPAIPTVQIDNARVRVTEWRFPPGTTTGFHRHEFDYVVVPMRTATLRILLSDGEMAGNLVAGQSYTRTAGTEHEVVNENAFEVIFVETELK
ncbi:MAG: cupin domain-containing protein [Chloroflexi bacterium]|nr:cupin domain-containing protein [Chloroflexota bacterium]